MIAIVAITDQGKKVGLKIQRSLSGSKLYIPAKLGKDEKGILFDEKLKDLTKKLFAEFEGIVFCMALGIVVRVIAPYLKDKYTDPAIVVVDEEGRCAISALSGHEGGANELALRVSSLLDAKAIITTASESKKKIIVGIGCRSGASQKEIEKAILNGLSQANHSLDEVKSLSTIDLKKNEIGLLEASRKLGIPLRFISSDLIKGHVGGYQHSDLVQKKIGVGGVCEPAALLGGRKTRLILPKNIFGRVTVALAEENSMETAINPDESGISPQTVSDEGKGGLAIIGIGPGKEEHLTLRAYRVLKSSEAIVGYKTYLKAISGIIKGKEVFTFGMGEEIKRCQFAIDLALKGRKVALVSSGDSGIYGMAGLVLELLARKDLLLDLTIIPGVSAFTTSASLLGAPLANDFALVSLSDLLTPWQVIEARLEAAAKADFVIVIYNPKSKKRRRQIEQARNICLRFRSGNTPVGITRRMGSDEESVTITDLAHMCEHPIDMKTTIIIGNSQTLISQGLMVTQRGYKI